MSTRPRTSPCASLAEILPLRHGPHHKQDVHPIRQQSGTITAQELERALINGDWTPFDLDKVKLPTTIFDTDRSGMIGFNEFTSLWKYIKDLQNIFYLTATAPTLPGPPVKLVIVIGKPVKDVSEVDALDYVLRCTAANDVSFCKHQMAVSQWMFSKAFDNTSPLGPCLVWPFFFRRPADKPHVKWTVLLVLALETLQALFFFRSSYSRFIERFGQIQIDLIWADSLQILAGYLTKFTVQVHFLTRLHACK
ncbi:Programmed cell death protein 6 [Mycena venus]|uniref:Programmed cell death protein 6 n=1 Tax=Mycena venus TaxID=2733690 RepID=A0A8H6Z820_9AGAR|nr:Programmed cell death protein 6 [Mycena venus]